MPTRTRKVSPRAADQRPRNRLLAGLPRADFQRLRPHLKTIPVKAKHVFHQLNEPITHVFFPNGGVASVTAGMKDGSMVEIATVGDEGLVGINAVFGSSSVGATMMQVPDTNAEALSVAVFGASSTAGDHSPKPSNAIPRGS